MASGGHAASSTMAEFLHVDLLYYRHVAAFASSVMRSRKYWPTLNGGDEEVPDAGDNQQRMTSKVRL